MARAKKKSSISTKISHPYAVHHPIAVTFNIHRNANGRLGSSTSHILSKHNTTQALPVVDSPEDFETACHHDGPDDQIEVENVEKVGVTAPVVSCFL